MLCASAQFRPAVLDLVLGARGQEPRPCVRRSPAEHRALGDRAQVRAVDGDALALALERLELPDGREPIARSSVDRGGRQHRPQDEHRRDRRRRRAESSPPRPDEPRGGGQRDDRKEVGAPLLGEREPGAEYDEHRDGSPGRTPARRQRGRHAEREEPDRVDGVPEGRAPEVQAGRDRVERRGGQPFDHEHPGDEDPRPHEPSADTFEQVRRDAGGDRHEGRSADQHDQPGRAHRADEALDRVDAGDRRDDEHPDPHERREPDPAVDRQPRRPHEQRSAREQQQLHVEERVAREREEAERERDDQQEQSGLEGPGPSRGHAPVIGTDLGEPERRNFAAPVEAALY